MKFKVNYLTNPYKCVQRENQLYYSDRREIRFRYSSAINYPVCGPLIPINVWLFVYKRLYHKNYCAYSVKIFTKLLFYVGMNAREDILNTLEYSQPSRFYFDKWLQRIWSIWLIISRPTILYVCENTNS